MIRHDGEVRGIVGRSNIRTGRRCSHAHLFDRRLDDGKQLIWFFEPNGKANEIP